MVFKVVSLFVDQEKSDNGWKVRERRYRPLLKESKAKESIMSIRHAVQMGYFQNNDNLKDINLDLLIVVPLPDTGRNKLVPAYNFGDRMKECKDQKDYPYDISVIQKTSPMYLKNFLVDDKHTLYDMFLQMTDPNDPHHLYRGFERRPTPSSIVAVIIVEAVSENHILPVKYYLRRNNENMTNYDQIPVIDMLANENATLEISEEVRKHGLIHNFCLFLPHYVKFDEWNG